MPCYHPITAYRSRQGRDKVTGKWPIVFNRNSGYSDLEVTIPCGQCIGCRLERSRKWAIRCIHEAQMHKHNCFITLTYNDDNLPEGGTLNKRHFVLFMKRLRKRYGKDIRFFHCGEYGEKLQRPHHHACIFNHDFHDKQLHSINRNVKLYRSKNLEKLWKYGYSTIGLVTFESAAYVARYIMKKITGKRAEEHYNEIDKSTGEILRERLPEYVTMSRRPGIGRTWYDKFKGDIYPRDELVIRKNFVCKPPRYYDDLYDIENHREMVKIKSKRKGGINPEENTTERLLTKEAIKIAKAEKLKRNYERK